MINIGFVNCNLRILMAEQGLNIQKVKDNTTLSRTTISNLYNNYGAGVQFDTMQQLCKLLKCQPGDLFTYYDVDVEFSILDNNIEEYESNIGEIYETFRKNPNIDQSINTYQLKINCDIKYQGRNDNFDFLVSTTLKFTTIATLDISFTISKYYNSSIENFDFPFPVITHVKNKLEEHLMVWTTAITDKPLDGWEGIQYHYTFDIEK